MPRGVISELSVIDLRIGRTKKASTIRESNVCASFGRTVLFKTNQSQENPEPMICVTHHPDSNIVEFEIEGEVTPEDFDESMAVLDTSIEEKGSIRILKHEKSVTLSQLSASSLMASVSAAGRDITPAVGIAGGKSRRATRVFALQRGWLRLGYWQTCGRLDPITTTQAFQLKACQRTTCESRELPGSIRG